MAVVNIVVYCTALSVVATLGTAQDNTSPSEIDENQWIVDAQNSISDSLSNIKLYGVENEKINAITDEAFDEFTKFVVNNLSKIIEQVDGINSEKLLPLKTQLANWTDALERLNKVSDAIDETPDKAIGKFYMTIDYISKEVVGFEQHFNDDSVEFDQIVEQLKPLLKSSVAKLVENAKSVKDQVSGISKTYEA